MKVVILGAGVIGVTSAYFLAKAGYQVVVIEKESHSALGCSKANGGQLSFSHIEPWNSKASLLSTARALLTPGSFVSFNNLCDLEFIKWTVSFIKNYSFAEQTGKRLLMLGAYSKLQMEQIIEQEKINFGHNNEGILHFYRKKRSWERALKQIELQKSLGCQLEILSPEGCVKKEPTLTKLFDENRLAGGILFKEDASGDCFAFTKSLAEKCAKNLNVSFEYNTQVNNIFTNYQKITGINTDQGVFTGDYYLNCLGSYGSKLLKGIGIDLKIYPLKGYSLSIPTDSSFLSPTLSLTDNENKVVCSKFGKTFRIAGMLEIGASMKSLSQFSDAKSCDHNNMDFLKRVMADSYSHFGDLKNAREWYGFRPIRPDFLPAIFQSKKYQNLFINSGHGSLGWTLACGSARIVADLISKGKAHNAFKFLGF